MTGDIQGNTNVARRAHAAIVPGKNAVGAAPSDGWSFDGSNLETVSAVVDVVIDPSNDLDIQAGNDFNLEAANTVNIESTANDVNISADGGNLNLRSVSGHVFLNNLPTSDPGIPNALWKDGSGFVRISP